MEPVIRIQPCKDPITKILFGRFGYKVVYFWIACNVMLILTSLYHGTLTKINLPFESSVTPVIVPLIKDKTFYIYFILGICGIILVNQVLKAIPGTFAGFWENRVLQSKTKMKRSVWEYNRQLREVEKKINSKKGYIYATIYLLISSFLISANFYRIPKTEASVIVYSDIRVFPLSGIAVYTTYAVLCFLLIIMIYKNVLLIYFLRKLHNTFNFQVNPLHPDRCGGLKPIGDFCIAINYIIFISCIAIGTFVAFPHSEELNLYLYLNLPFYVFLAIFFFIYPLWPIHNAMKEQKYYILSRLKEKLGPEYWEPLDELVDKGTIESSGTLKRVGKIDGIYEQTDKMRVWPFDFQL